MYDVRYMVRVGSLIAFVGYNSDVGEVCFEGVGGWFVVYVGCVRKVSGVVIFVGFYVSFVEILVNKINIMMRTLMVGCGR